MRDKCQRCCNSVQGTEEAGKETRIQHREIEIGGEREDERSQRQPRMRGKKNNAGLDKAKDKRQRWQCANMHTESLAGIDIYSKILIYMRQVFNQNRLLSFSFGCTNSDC